MVEGFTGDLRPTPNTRLCSLSLVEEWGIELIQPVYDEYSAVVYAMNSKNIRSSMVNGEWIMRNREVLHINKEQAIENLKSITVKNNE